MNRYFGQTLRKLVLVHKFVVLRILVEIKVTSKVVICVIELVEKSYSSKAHRAPALVENSLALFLAQGSICIVVAEDPVVRADGVNISQIGEA